MIEGTANRDFKANDITKRFGAIYEKATVKGYSVEALPRLGLGKNLLPDGCKNEDGSYVFTDRNSLITDALARFSVSLNGDKYSGTYKGIAILAADKKHGLSKLAVTGLKDLLLNGKPILSFRSPGGCFYGKTGRTYDADHRRSYPYSSASRQ